MIILENDLNLLSNDTAVYRPVPNMTENIIPNTYIVVYFNDL